MNVNWGAGPSPQGGRHVVAPRHVRSGAGGSVKPHHISTPTLYPAHTNNPLRRPLYGVEPDGICHCNPQPESSPVGECPRCHRLDARKAAV
jgi:hypothetical protein